MNAYEQKKADKIARYATLAAKRRQDAQAGFDAAHAMASVIPFGQPIHVGHHSEKGDRAFRGRIQAKFEKAIESNKTAAYWEGRAAAVANNSAISSDDPEAVQKLKAELASLELMQDKMKAANKAIRAGDDAALTAMALTAEQIATLKAPDFCGRIGFADYQLTNNGANIRRIAKRIEQLSAHANDQTTECRIGMIVVADNVESNRVQVRFPGIPEEAVRAELKANGFRWCPTEGCWQRMRSAFAYMFAKELAKRLLPADHQAALARLEAV